MSIALKMGISTMSEALYLKEFPVSSQQWQSHMSSTVF